MIVFNNRRRVLETIETDVLTHFGSLRQLASDKFVYLTDGETKTVTAYSVSATSGVIAAVGAYPIATGSASPIIVGQQ
jgi:hypothetical protein